MIMSLLDEIILQLILPEVAAWMRKEPDLTDEQIIARYTQRRANIIAKGKGFLAETANPTPASDS
jgi:hypothetical protein